MKAKRVGWINKWAHQCTGGAGLWPLIARITLCSFLLSSAWAETTSFVERLSVYGVVKPGSMTTLLAVNHGIVTRVQAPVGKAVAIGEVVIDVMEKETTRSYRSGIKGGVAKLHVTQGAAVTPGMPLSTIINPEMKVIEIALSPSEALKVAPGENVFLRNSTELFGKVDRISNLVDPDTGGVLATVMAGGSKGAGGNIKQIIGDVIPLDIALREIHDCKVLAIKEVDRYLAEYKVEAISGDQVCLKKRGN